MAHHSVKSTRRAASLAALLATTAPLGGGCQTTQPDPMATERDGATPDGSPSDSRIDRGIPDRIADATESGTIGQIIAQAGPDQTVEDGVTVSLNGHGTD